MSRKVFCLNGKFVCPVVDKCKRDFLFFCRNSEEMHVDNDWVQKLYALLCNVLLRAHARGRMLSCGNSVAVIFMQKNIPASYSRVRVCLKSIFDLAYPISRLKELIYMAILAHQCNQKTRRMCGGLDVFAAFYCCLTVKIK